MYRPFALYLGLKYLKAKKRNHFISFISAVSFLGIALGVAVLITVLSVMNGFDKEIRSRILTMVPHVTITQWQGELNNWSQLAQRINDKAHIQAFAPVIQGQGVLTYQGRNTFGRIRGIDPEYEPAVSPIDDHMIKGRLQDLKPDSYNIVIGKAMAEKLGVSVNDHITVIVPQGDFTPAGMMPRLKQFKVTGIFSVGYQYDRRYALMNIQDEATLLQMKGKVSNLQLKLDDLYNAPKVADKLNAELPVGYKAYDWTDSNSNFFKALQMEKTMMFLILALIVAVAAFNMLSTLVMVVTDKRSDIAILRTIGAGTKHIMGLFMVQGLAIGFIGTLAGVLSGVILALNTTAIVNWIQNIFNVKFLSAQVYYIDFLPSSLALSDVVTVALMALSMSFLATLYPAWKATRIDPAEVLRYE